MEFSLKKIVLIAFAIIGIALVVYYAKSQQIFTSTNQKMSSVAKIPSAVVLPTDTSSLSPAAKIAYDELSQWVPTPVQNQPAISNKPQTIKLPAGWTAREDYLLAVVPSTLPDAVKNYRGVIMRPPKGKSLSSDDAIFTVSDTSNPYFKGHCHTGATESTCYGGKNPSTQHVFDLMFYFSK